MEECILYSFRRCPYAMRARWALLNCKIKVILREVNLKEKPPQLLICSPKGTVPVLITSEGKVIDESLDIMKWSILNSKSNIISLPDPWNEYLHSNILIKENDFDFKYHLDRYKYQNRFQEDIETSHERSARKILLNWNQIIKDSSLNRNFHGWLSGRKEGLVDWAIWPFVRQYSRVNLEKFEKDKDLAQLRAWLKYFINHKLYKNLMKKYTKWDSSQKSIIYP